jgi:hypothetical protein
MMIHCCFVEVDALATELLGKSRQLHVQHACVLPCHNNDNTITITAVDSIGVVNDSERRDINICNSANDELDANAGCSDACELSSPTQRGCPSWRHCWWRCSIASRWWIDRIRRGSPSPSTAREP